MCSENNVPEFSFQDLCFSSARLQENYLTDILTTKVEESKEELKSLLMKVKEQSEKVALKSSTFRKLRSWHPIPSIHGK